MPSVIAFSYLNPPSNWVSAEPESPELLSLCIKKIRGLKKGLEVRNARFIWTEPHSRRISIEVLIYLFCFLSEQFVAKLTNLR